MKYGSDNHGKKGLFTHVVGHIAISDPQQGKTYNCRIRRVTMRKGKVQVEWVVFEGYEKRKGAKQPPKPRP